MEMIVNEQQQVDELAGDLLKYLNGKDSGLCVMAMLSVIDALAASEQATDAFRVSSINVLSDQLIRLQAGQSSELTH
jgi:hypothetical protein